MLESHTAQADCFLLLPSTSLYFPLVPLANEMEGVETRWVLLGLTFCTQFCVIVT